MARRPPSEIGATQAPDVVSAELQLVELDRLEPAFELEAVRVAGAELSESEAGSGLIEQAQLEEVELDGARLRGLRLLDVIGVRLGAANADWSSGSLRQVELSGCRLTGLNLGECRLSEVRLRECKLDYANFRHADLQNVSFEDCVLARADFQAAELRDVRFDGCQLTDTDFTKAQLDRVDFRGSQLALAGSLLDLRGAIVDSIQLLELARPLAQELGIEVEDS